MAKYQVNTAHTATPPGHTPSLMQQLGIDPDVDPCKVLSKEFYLHRRGSEARRRGIKDTHDARPKAKEPGQ